MSQPDYSILDASAAIVLFATGEIEGILAAWPRKIGIVEETLAEVLYLRDRASLRDRPEVQRISFAPLIDAGAIAVFTLQSSSEHVRFIRYAQLLDDGEAAAAAVARERGMSWSSMTEKRTL